MRVTERPSGTVAEGRTSRQVFRVEWDADGKVIRESLTPRTPPEAPPLPDARTTQNAPPEARKTPRASPWQLLTGAVGLLKAEFGVDAVDDATYRQRKQTCLACDNYDFGVCGKKSGCQCYLAAKVRVAGETCPVGKW